MTTMSIAIQDRSSRWLLIGSLALNLFFIGTVGSLAVRHYVMSAQPAATERLRTAAGRIERLAAPLPPADAEKLRAVGTSRAVSPHRGPAAARPAARSALPRCADVRSRPAAPT